MWVPTCSPLRDPENDAEPLHHELLSTDLSVCSMEPRGIWRGWWELRELLLPRDPEEGPHGLKSLTKEWTFRSAISTQSHSISVKDGTGKKHGPRFGSLTRKGRYPYQLAFTALSPTHAFAH